MLVYNVKGYDNRDKVFKGYSEGRSTIGGDNNLPEGTYFYILRYVKIDGSVDEKSGYLYIN
ncbi:MAG: gliding motility-associated C-terminal domain-containing protein [Flavobacterium sp.]|uniref:T9SS type B sorting domain-containing protein n=1 Tax=unclassified Flavobacterium TaxID=196869 RepID=UPI000C179808|nr:gliding motility-associated C-terminal domain-containing protein [Flavobacterium sp. 2]